MSSSSQTLLSTIFTDRRGRPLQIFVEASNVLDRPRLIRTLRSHGAQTTVVKEADIILVDEGVPDSLAFADQWPDKIVLSFKWVHQSVRHGQCFGAEDDWGGYLVRGQPLDSSDTKSPLLTPRETPSSETRFVSIPSGIPVPMASPESTQRTSNSPAYPPPGQPVLNPYQIPQQNASLVLNTGVAPFSAPAVAPLSALSGAVSPAVVQTFLELLTKGNANAALPSLAQVPGFAQPAVLPPPIPPPTADVHAFNQGSYPNPAAGQPSYHNQPGPRHSHSSNYGSRSVSRSMTPETHARSGSSKRKSYDQDGTPSPPRSTTGKGKERARQHKMDMDVDDPPEAKISSSGYHSKPANYEVDKLFTTKRGAPLQFVVDMTVRNRKELLLAIKKHGGIIMPDMAEGHYVILSSHADNFEAEMKRSIILDVPAVQADFVYECVKEGAILDEEEFSFDGVMVKGKRGKPNKPLDLAALRAELEETLESKPARRKIKKMKETPLKDSRRKTSRDLQHRASSSSIKSKARGDSVNKRIKKEESPLEEYARGTRRASSSSTTQTNGHIFDSDVTRSPSPLPPSNLKLVQYAEGRFRYTPEDDEYFEKYVAHLLRGDPDMSVQIMSQKLAEKMPHHTDKSWATYARREHGTGIIEKARKKAYIALRKRQTMLKHRPAPTNEQQHIDERGPDYVAEDLDIIVRYLFDGVPDEVSDDEAFARLAQTHPCRAAPTWEQFWDDHHEEILPRLQIEG